ncbi:MAG TPA: slipin family protein [Nitrospinaceae bacterium]|jgi:regulator of protease activity HflC (stomatin/prohibitin superfamily)|nr:slipin family protein [Nitrospinaceae bacterium]HJL72249.1 slipin family protein [Nitrospinaceae bacterium]|tara:strand:- start:43 stop:813 length:771 start_codon:yes stop_codon:yes gene_type:complete
MDTSIVFLIILGLFLFSAFNILREYERGVIFLLGRFWKVKGPGLIIVIPGIQKMVKVSLRTVVMDVPPQDIITRDNVTVKVNAVIYFRVMDARKAIIEVEDYLYATSQLAQTTLRSVLGQGQLDDLLSKRDEINAHLQKVIDEQTEPWGVKVANVEVKNVDLPQEMQRALAKQAEAERERRAKVINAQGEFEAAEKLGEAADTIGSHPPALQLRFLQTILDISTDRNTTTFFPLPLELFEGFYKQKKSETGDGSKE